jgi:hypothetical protein
VLTRAEAAAATGKPEAVRKLIEDHPNWREKLEPRLRRAEQIKKQADEPEGQAESILSQGRAAAFAGKPEEVQQLIQSHPQMRRALMWYLKRARAVQAEAEKSIRFIRQLQIILTRASIAAAAGKPDEVQLLMETHPTFREQLMPLLHQAIQVQFQIRAKAAAAPEAVEILKKLLQTYKDALESQPELVKSLKSLLAETDARVHAQMEIKLLEENILEQARNRVAAASSDEDFQLLEHWVDDQIARLPTQNPALASELKALVTQARQTLHKPQETAPQPESDDLKNLPAVRSQAAKFAGEGDLDAVRSLIAANPQCEPQLGSFLQEAVGNQIKRKASCAATNADIVALEELTQQHRALLDQNAELAAELDETIKLARNAIKARFKRKMWMLFLIVNFGILASLIGLAGFRSEISVYAWYITVFFVAAVGGAVMVRRHAPK